jgi:hypothetical protein
MVISYVNVFFKTPWPQSLSRFKIFFQNNKNLKIKKKNSSFVSMKAGYFFKKLTRKMSKTTVNEGYFKDEKNYLFEIFNNLFVQFFTIKIISFYNFKSIGILRFMLELTLFSRIFIINVKKINKIKKFFYFFFSISKSSRNNIRPIDYGSHVDVFLNNNLGSRLHFHADYLLLHHFKLSFDYNRFYR